MALISGEVVGRPTGGLAFGEQDLIVCFWAKRLQDGDFGWKAPILFYGTNQGFFVEKSTDSATGLRATVYTGSYIFGGYGTIPLNSWTSVIVTCFPSHTQYNPYGQVDNYVATSWKSPSVALPSGWSNLAPTNNIIRAYANYWQISDVSLFSGTFGNSSGIYWYYLKAMLEAGRTPASDPLLRNDRRFVAYFPMRPNELPIFGMKSPQFKQWSRFGAVMNNEKPPAVRRAFQTAIQPVYYSIPSGFYQRRISGLWTPGRI